MMLRGSAKVVTYAICRYLWMTGSAGLVPASAVKVKLI